MTNLERYRSIIPDWDEFIGRVETRDPPTIRARAGRISAGELRELLQIRGFSLEPVAGLPDHLRVLDGPHAVSHTPEHWLGLFYVQQASTGAAGVALSPSPGERVLDLCAAPGGKTTHLSDLMHDRGCLVAADLDEGRLRALLGNVYRTGHSNVVVVSADGRRFPEGALFDRVLVDAPCSAEGTLRRRGGVLRPQNPSFLSSATRRQESLLRRAIELTRPGGVVLYSTCTFAPEENEVVVTRVLADAGVEIEPVPIDAPHAPGVTEFDGVEIDPRLERAVRIYPHHLDSGGLFMARLRRLDDGSEPDPDSGWSPVPSGFPDGREDRPDPDERIRTGLRALRERHGIGADHLDGLDWMTRGEHVWAHRCREWPVPSWEPAKHWRVISVGLRALSPGPGGALRPTNDLLRILPSLPDTNVLDLAPDQWHGLVAEGAIETSAPDGAYGLLFGGHMGGRGVVRGGRLRHEIPKVSAATLNEIFEVDDPR